MYSRERFPRMAGGTIVRQHITMLSTNDWQRLPPCEIGPQLRAGPPWKSQIDGAVKRFTDSTVALSRIASTTFESSIYNDTLRQYLKHANQNEWATFQLGGVKFETSMFIYGSTDPRCSSTRAFVLMQPTGETKEHYTGCMMLLSNQYFIVGTVLYIMANGNHHLFDQFLNTVAWGTPQEKPVFMELFYHNHQVYLTAFYHLADGDRARVLEFVGGCRAKDGKVFPMLLECIVCKELLLEKRRRYFMEQGVPIRLDREEVVSTDKIYEEGIAAINRNDHNTAILKTIQMLHVNPNNGLALVLQVWALANTNRLQEAHTAFSSAVSLATSLQNSGKVQQAYELWDALLRLNPSSIVAKNGKVACGKVPPSKSKWKLQQSKATGSKPVATKPATKRVASKPTSKRVATKPTPTGISHLPTKSASKGNPPIIANKDSPLDDDSSGATASGWSMHGKGTLNEKSSPRTHVVVEKTESRASGPKAPPCPAPTSRMKPVDKKLTCKMPPPANEVIEIQDSFDNDEGATASSPKMPRKGTVNEKSSSKQMVSGNAQPRDSGPKAPRPATARSMKLVDKKPTPKTLPPATEVIVIDSFDDDEGVPHKDSPDSDLVVEAADTKPSPKNSPAAPKPHDSDMAGSPAPETLKQRKARLERERYQKKAATLKAMEFKMPRAERQSLVGQSGEKKRKRRYEQNKSRKQIMTAVAKHGIGSLYQRLQSVESPLTDKELRLIKKQIDSEIHKTHVNSTERLATTNEKLATANERVALAAIGREHPSPSSEDSSDSE